MSSTPTATFATVLALALTGACASEPPPPQTPVPPLTTAAVPDVGSGALAAGPPQSSPYPPTRKVDQVDVIDGVKVSDPYRWLEDAKSDEVKAWMDAEDHFAREKLAALPERDAIASRLKELFYVESVSIPHKFGARTFYTRRGAQQEKAVVYWRQGKTGAEKVLLDPNTWSTDGSVSLGGWFPSWDGTKVAYKVKANNSDEATMYVMDVATGKKSEVDTIEGAKYAGASWTPSGDGFYYTWLPVDASIPIADRPGYAEARFHKLGQDPKKDEIVHEKTGDPKTFLSPDLSKRGRWLVLTIEHGWTSTDVYFMDRRAPKPEWKPLAVGKDAMYWVEEYEDHFYIRTNEGAPTWRVFKADPLNPDRAAWKEIVPARADATLEGAGVVGRRLGLSYLKDVVSHVEVHDLDGKSVREIPLPTLGSSSGIVGDQDDDDAYYSFASFTYPTEIFETSVASGKSASWYKQKIPVDPTRYEVEQLFATSKDGTRVPMFVVHAKDFKKDGSAPTILYGYGGFQSPVTPGFVSSMYPWLERGGAYVFANLRGGSEYGEAWHRAGMRHQKQNVFDDFAAAGDYLVHEKYTSPSKLVARGASNGGLLVGAAVTERPDLFAAGLCGVPLLDMIRYHLFGSGKTWIEEYGSADDPDDFKALYAYSPYHHVVPGTKYPAVLLLSADADDRVDPMHARKFAAEMQAASTGGPVYLRIEKHSGHGGADLVKSAVEKGADELAFALAMTR